VTAINTEIDMNLHNGVLVTSAPSNSGTVNSVTLDKLDVHDQTANGAAVGMGIWLHGDTAGGGDIAATLNECKVHDNRNTGIVIDEDATGGTTTVTRETLTSNDIYNNNTGAVNAAVGGISFATASTLTTFTGNRIHGNRRDQILFQAGQNGGANWDLDPGSCTSTTAPRNQIYCYEAGFVGLRTTNTLGANPPDYTVDADRVTWAHATPSDVAANRDFAQGADTVITRANPCTAMLVCQ
jgi:hypothetical protein